MGSRTVSDCVYTVADGFGSKRSKTPDPYALRAPDPSGRQRLAQWVSPTIKEGSRSQTSP